MVLEYSSKKVFFRSELSEKDISVLRQLESYSEQHLKLSSSMIEERHIRIEKNESII
jgi:hypothetical protein